MLVVLLVGYNQSINLSIKKFQTSVIISYDTKRNNRLLMERTKQERLMPLIVNIQQVVQQTATRSIQGQSEIQLVSTLRVAYFCIKTVFRKRSSCNLENKQTKQLNSQYMTKLTPKSLCIINSVICI